MKRTLFEKKKPFSLFNECLMFFSFFLWGEVYLHTNGTPKKNPEALFVHREKRKQK